MNSYYDDEDLERITLHLKRLVNPNDYPDMSDKDSWREKRGLVSGKSMLEMFTFMDSHPKHGYDLELIEAKKEYKDIGGRL